MFPCVVQNLLNNPTNFFFFLNLRCGQANHKWKHNVKQVSECICTAAVCCSCTTNSCYPVPVHQPGQWKDRWTAVNLSSSWYQSGMAACCKADKKKEVSPVIACHKLLLSPYKVTELFTKDTSNPLMLFTGARFIRLRNAIQPVECKRGSLTFWEIALFTFLREKD